MGRAPWLLPRAERLRRRRFREWLRAVSDSYGVVSLSPSDTDDVVDFLEAASVFVSSISEVIWQSNIDDLLLQTESLLHDIANLLKFFSNRGRRCLLRAIAGVHSWFEYIVGIKSRGRPVIHNISENQLSLLLSFSFSPRAIANMLHVSEKTISTQTPVVQQNANWWCSGMRMIALIVARLGYALIDIRWNGS